MMTMLLALALALSGVEGAFLAQDPQFPLFERDPWNGFPVGSSVTRETTVNKIRVEEKITLKSADRDGKVLGVLRNGEEAEGPVRFTAFTAMLLSEGSGYKLTGKSNRQVAVGAARVRALVREISSEQEGGQVPWRITTADEAPGGIVEITWGTESENSRTSVSYVLKGQEKIKIQTQEVTCLRFELRATEVGKTKNALEGMFWLSSQVPGLLVRSRLKTTQGKESVETYVSVSRFEVAR